MEEKMKRESRKCLEVFFKKNDTLGSGSIAPEGMRNIMSQIIQNFAFKEELELVMLQYTKPQKYTTLDPQTNKLIVKSVDNAIDFPSALAIAVHFLKKIERRQSDAFAGKGLIRFTDLPTAEIIHNTRPIDQKRRLY